MTDYRLFGSTPGPASPVAFSGNFIAGMVFAANGGGAWFKGYWWWVSPAGQSTAPVKCALWSMKSAITGVVVPGSVVTSGALTAGQWNFIPVAQPLQMAPGTDRSNPAAGSGYIAQVGVNGAFPDTAGFWAGTGAAGLWGNGITGSPLFAYSGVGGTAPPPWATAQGVFSTASADPAAVMAAQVSGTDNFWVDVALSDTAPPGVTSYRLWPNKYDATPGASADNNVAYNIGTEVDVTAGPVTLNAIYYYAPPGAAAIQGVATSADVWNIGNQIKVAGITAPVWTNIDGSAAPANPQDQWLKATFPGGVAIPSGRYRVSVYNANGGLGTSAQGWNTKTTDSYFVSGAAANGISWGPLTAPNLANAQPGTFFPGSGTGPTNAQPVFAFDGNDSFPQFTTGNNPGQSYFVDLEVTPASAAGGAPPGAPPLWQSIRRRRERNRQ